MEYATDMPLSPSRRTNEFVELTGSVETPRCAATSSSCSNSGWNDRHYNLLAAVVSNLFPGFWLPRPLLADLGAELSVTCVKLEIDNPIV